MMKRLLVFAALLMVASMALAGCGQQVTAQEIVQHMRDTAANTNSAHLVVTVSGQVKGDAANATLGGTHLSDMNGQIQAELWYQKPNLLKVQLLSSNHAEYNGAFAVFDGTNIWAYDPSHKIAYKMDTTGLHELAGKANIPADLQGILENPNLESLIDQVLALTDYTLGPSEKVGAYQTYRLDLKPKAGSPAEQLLAGATATVWVDQTTWMPVKAKATASQGSGNMELSTFELNKDIPASTFQFTLPQGGHVIDLSGLAPRAVTIDQARTNAQQAGYTLLEPSYVPAGSTLVQVMSSRGLMGNGATTIMNYSGGSAAPNFWISELNGKDALGMGKGQPDTSGPAQTVTVRNTQGHLATHTDQNGGSPTAVLWWNEPGTKLTIALGGQISQDELLKIAAGLK